MPTYVYQVVLPEGEDADDAQVFEVVQKMSDPPLTHHPVTGQPVRRVIQPPNLPGSYTDAKDSKQLSDSNLSRNGFTRYEKAADGKYVKTAGVGPKKISGGPE